MHAGKGRQAGGKASRYATINAHRHAGRQAGKQASRQASKQANMQASRQAGGLFFVGLFIRRKLCVRIRRLLYMMIAASAMTAWMTADDDDDHGHGNDDEIKRLRRCR